MRNTGENRSTYTPTGTAMRWNFPEWQVRGEGGAGTVHRFHHHTLGTGDAGGRSLPKRRTGCAGPAGDRRKAGAHRPSSRAAADCGGWNGSCLCENRTEGCSRTSGHRGRPGGVCDRNRIRCPGGPWFRNPCTPENYGTGRRTTWKGRALAVIRAGKEPGEIRLAVSAKGLPETEVLVEAAPATDAAMAVKTENCGGKVRKRQSKQIVTFHDR